LALRFTVRFLKAVAAIVAESHSHRVFRSAPRTCLKLHACSAVIAEFAASRRLSALRAYCGFAFYIALPDRRAASGVADVSLHRVRPGLGYENLLPGGAFYAQAFVFIPAVAAYILIAVGAAEEMLLSLILSIDEGLLMLLAPFGAPALKSLGQDACRPAGAIAYARNPSAKEASQNARALPEAAQKAFLLVCFAFYKAGLIPVCAHVAFEGKLEARFC
jgi:hypothetical protein